MVKIILEIILIFTTFYLPSYLIPIQTGVLENVGLINYMIGYMVMAIPQTLLIIYIIWIQNENALKRFGFVKPEIKHILFSLIAFSGGFLILIIMAIITVFLPVELRDFITAGFSWKLDSIYQIPLVFIFCLVIGYREEVFFRSYLITRLSDLKLNIIIILIIQAFFFCIGHLYQSIMATIFAFLQGLFFGYLFYKKKNIHIIALGHALYNFTIFLISLYN